jgi:hypothetical protein
VRVRQGPIDLAAFSGEELLRPPRRSLDGLHQRDRAERAVPGGHCRELGEETLELPLLLRSADPAVEGRGEPLGPLEAAVGAGEGGGEHQVRERIARRLREGEERSRVREGGGAGSADVVPALLDRPVAEVALHVA